MKKVGGDMEHMVEVYGGGFVVDSRQRGGEENLCLVMVSGYAWQ